ncbi:hypothetical protein MSAS_23150 [Mycobacterium saskatchewanense]|nr:hypothetical protein [Mycobacterium saskatchewanense]BBX63141.1 hypothetical protein MSAS_23150 [Mycobacterium saskatchewanense]
MSSFKLTLPPSTALWPDSTRPFRIPPLARNGDKMGVLVYIVLTIAVFAVLGLAQKLVERL